MAVGSGVPLTEGSEGEFCGIESQARFVGVVIWAVTPKALLSENRSDLEIVADLGGRRGGGRCPGPLFLARKQSKDSNEKNDDGPRRKRHGFLYVNPREHYSASSIELRET